MANRSTAITADTQAPRTRLQRVLGAIVVSVLEVAGRGRLVALLLLAAVIYLRAADPTAVTALRFHAYDLFQKAAPAEMTSDAVIIVDIDEASIEALGQWPWGRDRMAALVDALGQAGAKAVGFDMVFSEPDRLSPDQFAQSAAGLPPMVRGLLSGLDSTDETMASAVQRAPVVLGMAGTRDTLVDPGELPPLTPESMGGVARVVDFGGEARNFLWGFRGVLRNLPVLEAQASGIGLFNPVAEHDGAVRRVPAALRIDGQVFPSLSLEMMRVAKGAAHMSLYRQPPESRGLAALFEQDGIDHVRIGDVVVPTDHNGQIWLHYSPYTPSLYLPALNVLSPDFDQALVRDKFVLIGTSAIGLRDLRLSPLGEIIPGVEVHAKLIDAMLTDQFIARPKFALGLEHLLTLALCLALIASVPHLTPSRSMPIFALCLATLWLGAFIAFRDAALVFDPTYPSLAVTLVYGALAYGAYLQSDAQKRRIRAAFRQYLSPAMVERLAENADSLQLGGETREMTFLFCDIAGFTSFVESAEPADLVRLLNEYLDGVCQIVMDHNGTIDKIVGDAVHAMFNAPLDDPDHAANAVRAALAVEAFVDRFRIEKTAEGFDFGTTRIGVNTGPVVVGNFGGSSRFDYTAHGDAINTAARLEGANKFLGTTICVAGSTAALCPDLAFRPIGALYLKGKDIPVDTFAPVRDDADTSAAESPELINAYSAAFETLRADSGPSIAQELFQRLAETYPTDPLIALHRRRLTDGAQGVDIRMTDK